MATHDYIISNASGAAVRADLNNALAAIVSNNSNASSPSTTYAYQWWADTTTGQLKLRNSANNAWITIFELDGTMLMENGSAASPGLAFASDLNTGFFRSAADKINFATGGVERLEIGSSEVVFNDGSNDVDFRVESNASTHMLFVDAGNNRVGIGRTSPANNLDIAVDSNNEGIQISSFTDVFGKIDFHANRSGADAALGILDFKWNGTQVARIIGGTGTDTTNKDDGALQFHTAAAGSASEAARIDSSGRLLVGTSTSRGDGSPLQVVNDAANPIEVFRGQNGTAGPVLLINKSRGSTASPSIVNNGDQIGAVSFKGYDGSNYVDCARIRAFVDGTPGSNDMPGRLVFSTTANGESSPTEQIRLDNSGNLNFAQEASSNYPEQKLRWSNDSTTGNGFYISQDSSRNGKIFHQQGLDILFGTNNTERARLDSSGRLLVGTSSSASGSVSHYARLQVQGHYQGSADEARISFQRGESSASMSNGDKIALISFADKDGGDYARIEAYADNTPGANDMPGRLVFSTCSDGASSPTERMRIRNDGTVLVGGTTVVSRSQHVLFEVGEGSNSFDIQRNNGSNVIEVSCQVGTTSGRTIQNFINPNGSVGGISISGSATTFETSSDYRLKENIVDLADGINRIKQLSPRRFNFIADANKTVDGFIAHEAQTIVPEAVRGAHNEVDDDGNAVMQGIDQSKLVPLLTAALQEAITKIETLETKVAALEAG
ncbi:hypothetical protein [uncultured Mediterranean phage uvMED]|nr:hypothetical protein [uncultured Mediterranean phage uvMED]